MLHLSCCRKYHKTRVHKFPKNLDATLNSGHQTGEMKQVLYSVPTYITFHRKCIKYKKKKCSWITCVTHAVYQNSKYADTYLQVFLLFLTHNLELVCHLHLSDPLSFLSLAAQFLTVFFSQSIQCGTGIFHLCQFILQSFIIHCNKNIKLASENININQTVHIWHLYCPQLRIYHCYNLWLQCNSCFLVIITYFQLNFSAFFLYYILGFILKKYFKHPFTFVTLPGVTSGPMVWYILYSFDSNFLFTFGNARCVFEIYMWLINFKYRIMPF